jgi:Ca-activated chloride channel homolog
VSFKSPELLVFLAAIPFAAAGYVWLEQRRTRKAAQWSSLALLPNMVVGAPGGRRYIPVALFGLALTLLLVGFARPEAKFREAKDGATVILMIDVSGSMSSNDVKPTRLGAADSALTDFVKKMPSNYRAAVLVFDNHVAVRVAPTYDRNALIANLPTKTQPEATALGDAISTAVKIAQKAVGPSRPGSPHPPASILLVSDGGANDGKLKPEDAAKLALKAAIPISTVSLGTPAGKISQNLSPGKGQKSVPVVTQVPVEPKTLEAVAKASGGRYYAARSSAQLGSVYKDMRSRLVYTKQFREITVGLAAAAVVLMLAGALLSALWFRRLV